MVGLPSQLGIGKAATKKDSKTMADLRGTDSKPGGCEAEGVDSAQSCGPWAKLKLPAGRNDELQTTIISAVLQRPTACGSPEVLCDSPGLFGAVGTGSNYVPTGWRAASDSGTRSTPHGANSSEPNAWDKDREDPTAFQVPAGVPWLQRLAWLTTGDQWWHSCTMVYPTE
eukprot:Skav207928  [mRNA]  locus=scaffold1441:75242:79794:+ [translate_table: standard]